MNDMIEIILSGSYIPYEESSIIGGRKQRFIHSLPINETVDNILKKEYFTKRSRNIFITPKTTLDTFLEKRFNLDLFGFMKTYAKLHLGEEFLLPVPSSIICMFYAENDEKALRENVTSRENILTQNLNDGPLNLHDNDIATFTLIKTTDLNLPTLKLWGGYNYSTDSFNFFIKSSTQFDLTVVYEEKRLEP